MSKPESIRNLQIRRNSIFSWIKSATVILSLFLCIYSCKEVKSVEVDPFNTYITQLDDLSFDLLIKQVRIFDGYNLNLEPTDLLVKNGKIQFIGNVKEDSLSIEKTYVADSSDILSPGFIDLHSHGNPLKNPEFLNFLHMGVTTICLGQDGTSPNFDDIGEWMDLVKEKPLGVNIAMFVGHGTLRLLSNVLYNKNPTIEDFEKMNDLADQAMQSGCFGMTSGLEYSPGKFADTSELIELSKIIGGHGGIIMSHIRNEDDSQLEKSIQELLLLGKNCPVHVSHIKSVYGVGAQRAKEIIQLLQEANNNGIKVTADQYPYLASYTGIGILFPDWAKLPNDYTEVLSKNRSKLKAYLNQRVHSRNGPTATLFGSGKYKGKTLQLVAQEKGKDFEDVLMDIGPYGTSAAYFVMNDSLQTSLLKSELIGIGSDGSPTMHHPRGYGTHAKIIEEFVNKRKVLKMTEGLRKMTSFPAKILGIADRGEIKVGKVADLVLFNPLDVKANATFENPHKLATGFKLVIINGKISLHHGEVLDLSGKILVKKKS